MTDQPRLTEKSIAAIEAAGKPEAVPVPVPVPKSEAAKLADVIENKSDAFWYYIPSAHRALIVAALRAYP